MGLRFRKSIKLAPGVKLNFNKNSTGLTFGGKGFHYTVNSKGKKTASVGIPGTGLSYSETIGKKKSKKESSYNAEEGVTQMKDKKSKKGCLPVAIITLLILGIISSCVGDIDETQNETTMFADTTIVIEDSTTAPYTTELATTELMVTETITEETSSTTEKTTETEKSTTTTTTKKATTTTKKATTTTKKATTTTKKATTTTKKATTTKKTATTTKRITTTKKADKNNSQRIYRTETGKRYHYENPCGNGEYYEVSYDEAIAAGLTPCQKCVQ